MPASPSEGDGPVLNPWQQAALNYAKRPKPEYPVVIGPGTMFPDAETLKEFLQLESIPAVSYVDQIDRAGRKVATTQVQVAHLDMGQDNDLRDFTEGERVFVFFGGGRRVAWVARCAAKDETRSG